MRIIGLTGNIASGKSTVARLLAERGIPLIDADLLAREAVAPFTPGHAAIVQRWGPRVLTADGAIDRPVLRRIVFNDPAQLAELNAIVHPEVNRRRRALLEAARARGERIVVCDIPLLYEAGLVSEVDAVLLVDAPERVRRDRLVRDRALAPSEAQAMIAAQMPAALKRKNAPYVIDNTGTLDDLRNRLTEVWTRIETET